MGDPETAHLCLNVELANTRPECLEYFAVHEMTSLAERSLGLRFTKLMDEHLPDWRVQKSKLDSAMLETSSGIVDRIDSLQRATDRCLQSALSKAFGGGMVLR